MKTDERQELLKGVCRVLHERGREATPEDVQEWMDKVQDGMWKRHGRIVNQNEFLQRTIDGEKWATMILHVHFGDSLS